jgi:hypothetical protein
MKPESRTRFICLLFMSLLTAVLYSNLCFAQSSSFGALTVRGKVLIRSHEGTWSPDECRVTLESSGNGQRLAESITGSDGIYYFRGIPPGNYQLVVYLRGQSVGKYPLALTPSSGSFHANGPYLDVPAIEVNIP